MRLLRYHILFMALMGLTHTASAQKKVALPHGMIFGSKPSTVGMVRASQLESYLGKRARVSASVIGTILRVTKPKGGWFLMDAGNGKIISCRFRDYKVTLPVELKGRQVVMSGIALKTFVADDHQQLAGNRTTDKNPSRKPQLSFEVAGLMVNK